MVGQRGGAEMEMVIMRATHKSNLRLWCVCARATLCVYTEREREEEVVVEEEEEEEEANSVEA